MENRDSQKQEKGAFRAMTPVHIRERQGANLVEVVFRESARFYKLFKKNPSYDRIVKLLRDSIAKKHALEVRCTTPESDVIEEVRTRPVKE